jgi:F-type H+-transporting ATPase subunit b
MTPDLPVYNAIIFLVLVAVLWRFAWGPISTGLAGREQAIADQIAAARAANDEARGLLAQYDQKLANAQEEVKAILDEARRDADHTRQEIVAAAQADARTERERARREIELATDQALKALAERSANVAVDLAGRIVQARLSPDDHAQLIQDALARFPRPAPLAS